MLRMRHVVTDLEAIDCSLLQALRRETGQLHRSLEENHRLRSLVSPEIARDGYVDILIRFYALYDGLEGDLLYWPEWEDAGFDFAPRLKTPLLLRDLDFFGIDQDACRGYPLPKASLRGTDFPSLLGTLYVTEGSTLGGQIIARHLKQNLDLGPDGGAAFFYGYGSDTGRRWEEFRAFLETSSKRLSDRRPVVAAARHAFAMFQEMMN